MSPRDPTDRRRALALLLGGLALAIAPLAPRAWADDNSGPGGGGSDHDDDDDDDDHSGPGGGGDDDRDDDHSGSGRGGDDDGVDRSGPGDGQDDDRGAEPFDASGNDDRRPGDIAVYYPDGWIERIVAGRYELIDHQRRLVVARPATSEDFARMIALR